jgi:hypothetical protein
MIWLNDVRRERQRRGVPSAYEAFSSRYFCRIE